MAMSAIRPDINAGPMLLNSRLSKSLDAMGSLAAAAGRFFCAKPVHIEKRKKVRNKRIGMFFIRVNCICVLMQNTQIKFFVKAERAETATYDP
jgi:hypothetical protein